MFYSGKSGCIRSKLLYLGKLVVLGQEWFFFGQSGSLRAKWLYSGNVVLIEQSGYIRGKVVILGQ